MRMVFYLSFHHSVLISSFYTVVMIKFTASSYTVNEGARQVEVCVELSGQAELARPIQMRVTSNDGTATGSLAVKYNTAMCSYMCALL